MLHLPSPNLAQHATSLLYDAKHSFATLLSLLKTIFNWVTKKKAMINMSMLQAGYGFCQPEAN